MNLDKFKVLGEDPGKGDFMHSLRTFFGGFAALGRRVWEEVVLIRNALIGALALGTGLTVLGLILGKCGLDSTAYVVVGVAAVLQAILLTVAWADAAALSAGVSAGLPGIINSLASVPIIGARLHAALGALVPPLPAAAPAGTTPPVIPPGIIALAVEAVGVIRGIAWGLIVSSIFILVYRGWDHIGLLVILVLVIMAFLAMGGYGAAGRKYTTYFLVKVLVVGIVAFGLLRFTPQPVQDWIESKSNRFMTYFVNSKRVNDRIAPIQASASARDADRRARAVKAALEEIDRKQEVAVKKCGRLACDAQTATDIASLKEAIKAAEAGEIKLPSWANKPVPIPTPPSPTPPPPPAPATSNSDLIRRIDQLDRELGTI